MKILMIAPEPFFQPRGTPISVYQRLVALSSLDYQVDLLTYHLGVDVDIPGVSIHRIPKIPFINHIRPGPSTKKLLLDPFLFVMAVFMLMTRQYDVIHSHEEASYFSTMLSKLFGIKHLYDMHSSLPVQLSSFRHWNHPFFVAVFKALEKITLRSSDAVVVVGDDLTELVARINPAVKSVKVENLPIQWTISTHISARVEDLKRNLKLKNSHMIVYAGTFEPYQGLDMLVNSAELVVRQCPDSLFLMIGGNEQQVNQYKKIIGLRNLLDHFYFTGMLSANKMLAYLDLATIVVSPRLNGTSIPLKIYTYLSSGKPIVATNIPAHRQLLDKDLAVLTEPNEKDFAQGIMQLLGDARLRNELASKAQAYANEKYQVDAYQKRLESVYQSLKSNSYSPLITKNLP